MARPKAPVREECIRVTSKEMGVDESIVREVAEELDRFRKQRTAAGQLDKMDDAFIQEMRRKKDMAAILAARHRFHTARNVLIRRQLTGHIETLMANGLTAGEALEAVLIGTNKRVPMGRVSVATRRTAMEKEYQELILRRIEADLPHMMMKDGKLLRTDDVTHKDIVREMWEIRPDGKFGRTGNKDAQYMAKLFAEVLEDGRVRLNAQGAFIGRLDGYAGPQKHNPITIGRVTKEEWSEFTFSHNDTARSFPGMNRDEIMAELRDTYDDIILGRAAVTAAEKGKFPTPANIAKTMGRARVLHFASADSWIAYNERFGTGSIVDAMMGETAKIARKLSLMEMLGPNPEVMLESMRAKLMREARERGDAKALKDTELTIPIGDNVSRLGQAYTIVSGADLNPVHVTAAKLSSNVRKTQDMAKLGQAALVSVIDTTTWAETARFHGKTMGQAYHDMISGIVNIRNDQLRTGTARYIGSGFDAILGHINSRYSIDDVPGSQSLAEAHTTFFKLSGLTGWTERLEDAFTQMTSNHMGDQTLVSFNNLDAPYKQVLGLHGIDERRWGLIKHMIYKGDGKRFVIPEFAQKIPDEVLRSELKSEIEFATRNIRGAEKQELRAKRLVSEWRNRLQTDVQQFFSDEARYAVIHGDDRSKLFWTRGTRPGTGIGEALRFLSQFKAFPTAFAQRHGRRSGVDRAFRGDFKAVDWQSTGHLLAGMWIMGYVAMSMKELARGRTPPNPLTSPGAFAGIMTKAFVQGGAAGMYGDLLLGHWSLYGNPLLENLAGPTAGAFTDVFDLIQGLRRGDDVASKAWYTLISNTPYANLWYTRAATDWMIMKASAQFTGNDGGARREDERLAETGQVYMLPR